MLGCTSKEVQSDRFAAAEALAERTRQVVVLKGAGTIVAHAQHGLRVCTRGTPAMATGGTGDVLAGVVGALLASMDGGSAEGALTLASVAVLWHALAGEAAAVGDRGLLASELADALPGVLVRGRPWQSRGPDTEPVSQSEST